MRTVGNVQKYVIKSLDAEEPLSKANPMIENYQKKIFFSLAHTKKNVIYYWFEIACKDKLVR